MKETSPSKQMGPQLSDPHVGQPEAGEPMQTHGEELPLLNEPSIVPAGHIPVPGQEQLVAALAHVHEGAPEILLPSRGQDVPHRVEDIAGPSGESPQRWALVAPQSVQPGQTSPQSRTRAAGQRRVRQEEPEEGPRKRGKAAQASGPQAVARHIITEQQRRDREKAGFAALRELIPLEEKLDKATFLKRVVSYISELQDLMQQLLARGALSSLPTEMQWNVRMLLPRRPGPSLLGGPPRSAPAAVPLGSHPAASLALPQLGNQAPGLSDASQLAHMGLGQAGTASLPILGGTGLLPLLQPAVQAPLAANALALGMQAMMTQQLLAVLAGAVGQQAQNQAAAAALAQPHLHLQQLLPQALLAMQPGPPAARPALGGAPAVGSMGGMMAAPQQANLPSASAPESSEVDSGAKSGGDSPGDSSQGSRPVKMGSKMRRQTAATIAPPDLSQATSLFGRPEPPNG